MKICIVGAGYVGLTTAAVLAELGHTVRCVDRDAGKINRLKLGDIPIYEPGLEEMVRRHSSTKQLIFSDAVMESLEEHAVVMIAVGTPSASDGAADLVYVRSVLEAIATTRESMDFTVVIMKSTVPPGTGEWAESFLMEKGLARERFEMVSNPEFLREGTAIYDSFHPDRIVIGTLNAKAAEILSALYQGITADALVTGRTEAELIKYGSNAFLATKLSFINELSRVCEAYQADIMEVATGIGMDNRIGGRFLHAGIGYGGSCLPKDVQALIAAAAAKQVTLELLHAVTNVNSTQLDEYVHKLEGLIGEIGPSTHIAIWGATFKENTDDIRYSQSIALMNKLAFTKKCMLKAYDPLVSPPIDGVDWMNSPLEAVKDADALIVATGWDEFLRDDWHEVKTLMKGRIVLDGRNALNKEAIEASGLKYAGVGRR